MTTQAERLRQEIKLQNRHVAVQASLAIGAAVVIGLLWLWFVAAIFGLILHLTG